MNTRIAQLPEAGRAGATILGLNAFHADSAACLVRDGQLVAAVAEERLNRVKHFAGFPEEAIRYCLDAGGVSWDEVDCVAVGRRATANWAAKLGYAVRHPFRVARISSQRLRNRREVAGIGSLLTERLGCPADMPIRWVEHHLAHAASAFFVSPFDEAAVFSVDGFGDFASTLTAAGRGNTMHVLGRTLFPHSLGVLYTALCQFIGFNKYGDEGKVMGLAPYGEPTYERFFDRLVRLKGRGRFELNLDYFIHHTMGVDYSFDEQGRPTVAPLYSWRLVRDLGPPRWPNADVSCRDMNVAASLQRCLEKVYFHILNDLHERTGLDDLCLAGGVALNSVANGKLFDETGFTRIYTQPAASDDGTAVGAAYFVEHQLLGRPRGFVMDHAYWGPAYPEGRLQAALAAISPGQATVHRTSEGERIERTARALADGQIVGWYQGAAEWGPRALGNRSILAHPGWPGMKDRLNARVKHREPFRPFAPVILQERIGQWFEHDHPSPFMMMVYKTRPAGRERISAINHVDDTGRLQTVSREQNPTYYALVEAFERLTGTPVLLNTSFNENEPIVTTPEEAVDCFLRTQTDVLVMGPWFVQRAAEGRLPTDAAA